MDYALKTRARDIK